MDGQAEDSPPHDRVLAIADQVLQAAGEGRPLDPIARRLVELGVRISVASLDKTAAELAIAEALAAGARPEQIQETIALISGLGMHSLMIGAPALIKAAAPADERQPLTEEQRELWSRFVGERSYWRDFETEFPGFLESLLRLSPLLFQRFHEYCAVPWETSAVAPVTKELIAMASDAVPTHTFLPGLRLHMRNAVKLGAGRADVLEALCVAADAPGPSPVEPFS